MIIYLDHSATTKPSAGVVEEVRRTMQLCYGNPSSLHAMGLDAARILSEARSTIARSIGALPDEIIFTSGGTEGDNQAIFGIWEASKRQGRTVITSAVEHPAVLRACERLEAQGARVIYLPVNRQGLIEPEVFQNALTSDTILVSLMHSNNETGAQMPIEAIGRILSEQDSAAVFHTDAVQSYGKTDLDMRRLPVDIASLSAHKIHGPKGVGALYVRGGTKLSPLLAGGGQERGFRSGTENVPGIAGFVQAVREQSDHPEERRRHLADVKSYLRERLLEEISDVSIHTPEESIPSILNAGFPGCRGEVLLRMLEQERIYVSTGSACSSKKAGSHVLAAMDLDPASAEGALRFSFAEENSREQMDRVVEVLKTAVDSQRKLRESFGKGRR